MEVIFTKYAKIVTLEGESFLVYRGNVLPIDDIQPQSVLCAVVRHIADRVTPIGFNVYTTLVSNGVRILGELNMSGDTEMYSILTRCAAKIQREIDKENENAGS